MNLRLNEALLLSVVRTLIARFALGALRGASPALPIPHRAGQTMFVGAVAFGAACLITRAGSGPERSGAVQ